MATALSNLGAARGAPHNQPRRTCLEHRIGAKDHYWQLPAANIFHHSLLDNVLSAGPRLSGDEVWLIMWLRMYTQAPLVVYGPVSPRRYCSSALWSASQPSSAVAHGFWAGIICTREPFCTTDWCSNHSPVLQLRGRRCGQLWTIGRGGHYHCQTVERGGDEGS